MPTEVVHPLSSQQELWRRLPGAFGPRFILAKTMRITGHVDVAALQGALDDVVVRHEMLRTLVVADADPPHQEVHAPSPAPLEVRDLPPAAGRSRDEIVQELIRAAERSSVPIDELPLLRAVLARFDDRDSVLSLISHHTACDGWSLNVVARDVAALYAARASGRPAELPTPCQYGDYVRWQLASTVGERAAANVAYWRRRLEGAQLFTLPTDRPVRQAHESPYVAHDVTIPADVAASVIRLAKSMRGSSFVVMLSAFYVLAHRIRDTVNPVVNTIIHGRNQRQFRDTVGPLLNFLALRADLSDCASFRDVLARTRVESVQAYDHEVPIQLVERAIPSLLAPLADPRACDFIYGFMELPIPAGPGDASNPFLIAEGTQSVYANPRTSEEMPGGAAWNMGLVPNGEIFGYVQFNPDEFDDATVSRWVAEYERIVAAAVAGPDRAWDAL
jgi:condensation enzyme